MRAIYTEAAKRELDAFHERQKILLEELVAERKAVLGDDVLEITASDIKDASQRIRTYRPTIRRYASTELVTRAYIVVGIVMMIGSFLYKDVIAFFETNRTQGMVFLMGASMTTIGWVFRYWLATRRRRYVEDAERYLSTVESSRRLSIEQDRRKDSA